MPTTQPPRPRLLAGSVARFCLLCLLGLGLARCGKDLSPAPEAAAARPAWGGGAAPASRQALDAWLDPAEWQAGGHLACDSSPPAADGSAPHAGAPPACQHLHQMLPLRAAATLCRASGGGFAPDWGLCHCPPDSWFVVGEGCQAVPIAGNLDPSCPASLAALLPPGWEGQGPQKSLRAGACLKQLTLGASAWRVGDDIVAVAVRQKRLRADLLRQQPSSWSTCVGPPASPQQGVAGGWLVTSPDAAGLAEALANISPAARAGTGATVPLTGLSPADAAGDRASSAATRVVFWEPSPDGRKRPSAVQREQACRLALSSLGVFASGPPEGRSPSRIFGDMRAEAEGPDERGAGRGPLQTDRQELPDEAPDGSDHDGGEADDSAEAEVASLLGNSADHPCGQLERLATALQNAALGRKKMPVWRRVTLHAGTPSIGLDTVVAEPMESRGPLAAQLQWLMQEGAVLQRRLHLREASMEMVAFLAADGRLLGVATRALPAPRDGSENSRDGGAYRLWSRDFQPLMATP